MTRDPPNIGFDPACCLSLDTCSKSSQKLSWAASQLCQQGMSDTTGFPLNTKEQLWPPHGAAACAALSRLLPAQTCFVTTSPRLVNLDKHGAMTFALSSHQNAKKNTCCQLFWHFINDKSTLDVPGHRTKRDSFFASRSLSTITTLNEVNFRI